MNSFSFVDRLSVVVFVTHSLGIKYISLLLVSINSKSTFVLQKVLYVFPFVPPQLFKGT